MDSLVLDDSDAVGLRSHLLQMFRMRLSARLEEPVTSIGLSLNCGNASMLGRVLLSFIQARGLENDPLVDSQAREQLRRASFPEV